MTHFAKPSVRHLGLAAALAAACCALPASAGVKEGVDAWAAGDFAAAVMEWQGPADTGDADAMYNLAQAYRLGKGVPQDAAKAEYYYSEAAMRGHIPAADTYGLILFQSGRREMALPYVEAAAQRGDPRARYLYGIALFNGVLVQQDWVKAYAHLTLANSAGLAQAADALLQMDQHIPIEQRQEAQLLARQLDEEARAIEAQKVAEIELALKRDENAKAMAAAPEPATTPQQGMQLASAAQAGQATASRAALQQVSQVTGQEDPAAAGASFARPAQPVAVSRPAPNPGTQPQPQAQPPAAARPAAAPAASGPWKIQLGAFSVSGSAEKLWSQLSGRSELAGKQRILQPAGSLTKLLAGGFASREQAASACERLKNSGQGCYVTK